MAWASTRHWYMAPISPLLDRVLGVATTAGRASTSVQLQARISSPSNAILLSNRTADGAGVLPAGVALMAATAAADTCCSLFSQAASPQVLLVNSVFGQLVHDRPCGGVLELVVKVQAQQGTITIGSFDATGASHLVMTAATACHDQPTIAQPEAPAISTRLPPLLAQLMSTAQQQHDHLPGPVVKAQVAAASTVTDAVSEPAIAAACQLEASLMLPYFTSAAPVQLPAALDSCLLNPRGFDAHTQLDLVDPDMPQPARSRTSNFWLSSASSGVLMQLRGMMFCPLDAARQPTGPITAVATPVMQLSTAAGPLRPGRAADAPAATTDLAERVAAAAALEEPEGVMYSVEWVAAQTISSTSATENTAAVAQLTLAGSVDTGQMLAGSLQALQVAQAQATGLQMLTCGALNTAVSIPSARQLSSNLGGAAAAMPWAMLRAAAQEQPDWQLSACDVHPYSAQAKPCATVTLSFSTGAGSTSNLYGNVLAAGAVYAARLARFPEETAVHKVSQLSAPGFREGTCIITGGAGAVGLVVAEWLTQQLNVQHVHFVSRSGTLPTDLINTLMHTGGSQADSCMVTASKADVSTAEDAAAIGCSALEVLPVMGVFHAAGVISDGLLAKQTPASMRTVFSPKVAGLHNLQQTLLGQPTAAQVLFSSVAALLGSPGQSNYAAANAGLDAVSAASAACGLPCHSIQYGAWAGSGMAGRDAQTAARAKRLGIGLLQPQQALAALAGALAAAGAAPLPKGPAVAALTAAAPIRWSRFLSKLQHQPPSDFFSKFLVEETGPAATGAGAVATAATSAVGTLTAHDLAVAEQQAKGAVTEAVSTILGVEPSPDEPLMVSTRHKI
eukprot:GHUV01015048.1.p1 GENE.GHUV01015048.1~~GHUV01015048.1.p1  ORF type:complete len:908 (+),score=339.11 GHUV01015048.1:186-2726(+)